MWTDLQVGADPPEDVVDTVSGQQGHKHVLRTETKTEGGQSEFAQSQRGPDRTVASAPPSESSI